MYLLQLLTLLAFACSQWMPAGVGLQRFSTTGPKERCVPVFSPYSCVLCAVAAWGCS